MVYVIYNDDTDGLSYLEQVAPDGSYRKRLFEIGAVSPAYCLTFHDEKCVHLSKTGKCFGI